MTAGGGGGGSGSGEAERKAGVGNKTSVDPGASTGIPLEMVQYS